MLATARTKNATDELGLDAGRQDGRVHRAGVAPARRQKSFEFVVAATLALGLGWSGSSLPKIQTAMGISTAHAQPADGAKQQQRAKIKSAAEELNGIASSAPDKIRSMFAGNTPGAELVALDEKSVAAQAQLEAAVLAANESGALSPDETKELARLGDIARKTRGPVKEDIETLKTALGLPLVGGDTAVRLAPKSQQDAVIKNAEDAKAAVAALAAAIRKLP